MPGGDSKGRLLVEQEPHTGAWNMAYDEALLEAAANRGETVLRIFQWSQPTLSLGYFQKTLPPDLPEALRALPRVRRLSGGGAILHHHEWTYSCAIPKSHPFAKTAEILYEEVHRALIDAFHRLGVNASLRVSDDGDAAFLCFLRGDPRDIVVAGRKVVGSAQRRRRGAVLQHGSVLLRHSPLTPSVPGLLDLAPHLPNDPWLGTRDFAAALGPRLFDGSPVEAEHPDDASFARNVEAENVTT
ncbi:MAG: lipoate--protein ligase family protein [Planctomycetaceae bacterium]|nr:lipoate--protein ligase family protein [Planctomycetaceae bacterium]